MKVIEPEEIVSSFLRTYKMEEFPEQQQGTQDLKSNIFLQLILFNREKIDTVKENIKELNLPTLRLSEDNAELDLANIVENLESILSVLNVESDSLDIELSEEIQKIQSMVDTLSDLKMGSSIYNNIDQCGEQLLGLEKELLSK